MKGNLKYLLVFAALFIAIPNAIAQYTPFFGNLHSHTSYSDGSGTPPQAFAYARDVAGIDFLAVTDHLEQIYFLPWNWILTKNAANDATVDGVFIGIAGYEWSCPLTNHVNVFNTPDMVTPLTYLDWPGFCEDLLEEHPAFAQFNHPGREELALDWDNFAYVGAAIDSAFALIEVREFYQDSFYQMALDSGWHVSPVSNQDNHSPDWGNKNDSRAGIWATALTRTALFEAIVAGRTFSTLDKNARIWIELDFTPMGSRIIRAPIMRLRIDLYDPDEEGWTIVEVRGSGNTALVTLPPRTTNLDTTIVLDFPEVNWLFVRACQPDGQWIWSAPVYLENEPLLTEETSSLPERISLSAHPNPFNSAVTIGIDKRSESSNPLSRIEIFDVNGRIVDNIAVGAYGIRPGNVSRSLTRTDRGFVWRPDVSIPSGVYLVRANIEDSGKSESIRIIYIK
jgi:hypothetical protein